MTPQELGQDLPAGLGVSPGELGGGCGSLWGQDIGHRVPGNNHECDLP